jgi:hypothetical protein
MKRFPFQPLTASIDNADEGLYNDYMPSGSLASPTESESGHCTSPSIELPGFVGEFAIAFRFEGTYKVKPVIARVDCGEPALKEEDLFVPVVSFNVVTRV